MNDRLRLSLVQMTSSTDPAANVGVLERALDRAAAEGAQLVAFPEGAGVLDRNATPGSAPTMVEDPWFAAARDGARRAGLWIHAGSTPIAGPGGRALNRSLLIAPDGTVAARYDKIHLFDVFLDGQEPSGESTRFAPGEEAVIADTPWGPFGLTICYDLRFPHLFRAYGAAGARVIFVPSAFTVPTGRAHWHVLLRARAIETGAWIVASAQCGEHPDGRMTWGHSLVVSPWGEVVCDLGGGGPAQATVDLDLTRVAAARTQIPSLTHDRPFVLSRADAPALRPEPVT